MNSKIKTYSLAKDTAKPNESFIPEADRRLKLGMVPNATALLRWEKRPRPVGGNPAWTYMVDAPNGAFAVSVGHIENGHASPFEVWVMGEAPRGLSALAKSVSMDMRSMDRAWLKKKLESLAKCPGQSFVMAMPDGINVRVPSEVAAFARLVLWRCNELNAFADEGGAMPLIEALMSKREPKTTTEGTLSWTVDVANVGTGDDFVLFLKEATLPNGQRRPFSIWLAGDYPRSLDGLCKSLSLDMRIVDVGWVLRKLDQIADAAEGMGGFMAQVPGKEKSSWYASTVAYIAALVK
ncbi:ribonucleoside-diphosphate reductase, adenosylcobalamin-dependent, partial [mine drainage metagenome]